MGLASEIVGWSSKQYCDTVQTINYPDSAIISNVNVVMWALSTLGYVFLKHYESATGLNLIIPTESIIQNDSGVKKNILTNLQANISNGSGTIANGQEIYENLDFKLSFGGLNFQWRKVYSELVDSKEISVIDIWFVNRYRWHETVKRVSQCMHQAFSHSSGTEFDMIGRRVFYFLVKNGDGSFKLLMPFQESSFLSNLRLKNQPAAHTGVSIISYYPETLSYLVVRPDIYLLKNSRVSFNLW